MFQKTKAWKVVTNFLEAQPVKIEGEDVKMIKYIICGNCNGWLSIFYKTVEIKVLVLPVMLRIQTKEMSVCSCGLY